MTFSYFLLCEFDFYYDDSYYTELINKTFKYTNETNSAKNIDFTELKKDNLKLPTILEYVLIFWMVTIIIEEIRQVSLNEIGDSMKICDNYKFFIILIKLFFADFTSSLKMKLTRYLNDGWNYLDMGGCFFFFLGILLRDIALFQKDENTFKLARYVNIFCKVCTVTTVL
jgi:hypothetical protein